MKVKLNILKFQVAIKFKGKRNLKGKIKAKIDYHLTWDNKKSMKNKILILLNLQLNRNLKFKSKNLLLKNLFNWMKIKLNLKKRKNSPRFQKVFIKRKIFFLITKSIRFELKAKISWNKTLKTIK